MMNVDGECNTSLCNLKMLGTYILYSFYEYRWYEIVYLYTYKVSWLVAKKKNLKYDQINCKTSDAQSCDVH